MGRPYALCKIKSSNGVINHWFSIGYKKLCIFKDIENEEQIFETMI